MKYHRVSATFNLSQLIVIVLLVAQGYLIITSTLLAIGYDQSSDDEGVNMTYVE